MYTRRTAVQCRILSHFSINNIRFEKFVQKKCKFYRRRFAVIILSILLVPAALTAQDDAPALDGPVVDSTGRLSVTEIDELSRIILQLEDDTGAQMAVLVLASTQPETIEQFSIRLAEVWKIGRAKEDDGVMVIVAVDDRRLRIEVGYGLEGAVPDVTASRIIRQDMVPHLKDGRLFEALRAGLVELDALIRIEHAGTNKRTTPESEYEPGLLESLYYWFVEWLPHVILFRFLNTTTFVLLAVLGYGGAFAMYLFKNPQAGAGIAAGAFAAFHLIQDWWYGYAFFAWLPVLLFAGLLFLLYTWFYRSLWKHRGRSSGSSRASSSASRSSSAWSYRPSSTSTSSSRSSSSSRSYSSSSSSSSSSSRSYSGGGGSFGGGGASGSW